MKKTSLAIAVGSALLAACSKSSNPPPANSKPAAAAAQTAGGTIQARSGSKMGGTVQFVNGADGLTMTLSVTGATPGQHGVHLHVNPDCAAIDASSAGGHFNPTNAKHGGPNTPVHHAGDLGNLTVGADGTGTLTEKVTSFTFADVTGHALVVHEKADDLATDPSGNSGARQGCAVIAKM